MGYILLLTSFWLLHLVSSKSTSSFRQSTDSLLTILKSYEMKEEKDGRKVNFREKITTPIPTVVNSKQAGWQCHSCLDVVETLRSQIRCDGMSMNSLNSFQGRLYSSTLPCGNNALCGSFLDFTSTPPVTTALSKVCYDLQDQLYLDKNNVKVIWAGNINKASPFDTCKLLKFCTVSTSPGDDESICTQALNQECSNDPNCELAITKCKPQCLSCYWIVKSYPFFRDSCLISEVKDALNVPTTAVTTTTTTSSNNLVAGVGSPDFILNLRPDAVDSSQVLNQCIGMWNEFMLSSKARYLITYANDLNGKRWDPFTVCQCLSKCSYNQYEALDILNMCAYNEDEAFLSSVFPDLASGY